MTWTVTPAFSVGEVLTSLAMTNIGNDLDWLGGASGRGTSFPASPVDGQPYVYTADATNGVEWTFKYNAGSGSTYKWEFVGGPPLFSEVATQETTSSGSYAALTTAGPSVTTPRAGDYFVDQGAWFSSTASVTEQLLMSYDIGATGAVDADAVIAGVSFGGTIAQSASARRRLKTGIAASTAFVSKYKINPGGSAGYFGNRWISLLPVRVI